jgi:hypothetical protein
MSEFTPDTLMALWTEQRVGNVAHVFEQELLDHSVAWEEQITDLEAKLVLAIRLEPTLRVRAELAEFIATHLRELE